jgi:hypothetical protein
MGGCGKTTLTVACVRDAKVRRHFERIGFIAVSQKPNMAAIMAKLFAQLSQAALAGSVVGNVDLSFQELQGYATGRVLLVVLDDVSFLLLCVYEVYLHIFVSPFCITSVPHQGVGLPSRKPIKLPGF